MVRDLARRMRRIKLLALDFDGVLTDNTVIVGADGSESVRCWRGDGLGLRAVERVGIRPVVLSTEPHAVVSVRCGKLKVPCHQGLADKRATLIELAERAGLKAENVAYVGNDVNDLGCLEWAGLPIVVADAHPSVRRAAVWRTRTPGGFGAVREVCDRFAKVLGDE